ncbi:copper amine oxidase N-terminal domain-containing protein [Paenibacillus sp. R14(2021)]|uniref:copper amine oxidase N-terminal domain-containing protein n=1 Tax=Paenibacillus sp. R14(2021) TaxID=2859228 RepID=UPI001C61689C|nr:copper amine oxidase N-terminal domain-containing protein [Paenibacillus sp. R14(2021)]
MKKRIWLIVCTAALLTFNSNAYAAKPIAIHVKGKDIQSTAAPIIEKGRALVPLRVVAEALGVTVVWDAKQQTASISKYTKSVKLMLGQKEVLITDGLNEYTLPLETTLRLFNGKVYVPLRLLSEVFGYKVAMGKGVVSIASPLNDSQRSILDKGDLLSARKMVMNMVWNQVFYAHKPLQTTHAIENYSRTFIFPEGKALRFYMIDSDETVSLFELRDDYLVAIWQAHMDIYAGGDGVMKFAASTLFDETGPKPTIGSDFIFYSNGSSGDSSDESSGSIDANGQVTTLGYIHKVGGEVTNSDGTVSLTLPHETRLD